MINNRKALLFDNRTSRRLAQAIIILSLCAIVALFLNQRHPLLIERSRSLILDLTAPTLNLISSPFVSLKNTFNKFTDILDLQEELAETRNENSHLFYWKSQALKLEAENRVLRSFLELASELNTTRITARVISSRGGPFAHNLVINAGKNQKLRKNQPVIAIGGVVGRIVEAGQNASRILLVNDVTSRIPVLIESTRSQGIAAGNNMSTLHLIYVQDQTNIKVGHRVVTSGRGGVFPPGLLIGTISSIDTDKISLQSHVDWDRLEFVQVIDFNIIIKR